MAHLTLKLNLDNAAFRPWQADGDPTVNHHEVARLLANAAESVEAGTLVGTLRDINGNTVGGWAVSEEVA